MDQLLEMNKGTKSTTGSDDDFRPKPRLGTVKIFDGDFWMNWWFNAENKKKAKVGRIRHF